MLIRLMVLALTFAASVTEALGDDFLILFTNVYVFDGVNEELIENANVFVVGLKDAIDQGLVKGPRVLPSGSRISQSSGRGLRESVRVIRF